MRESFTFRVRKEKLRETELVDGHYLLRSNIVGEDPAVLWERYIQLTQIEAAFKSLKGELGIRPIFISCRAGLRRTSWWRFWGTVCWSR